ALQSHLRFCIQCGMPVPQEEPANEPAPKPAASAKEPAPIQPARERKPSYEVPAPTSPMAAVGEVAARISEAPPAQAPQAAVETTKASACLRMIDSQGRAGDPIALEGERIDLGRLEGEIRLADD